MSPPLSIALVCWPTLGGSGVVASELALGLVERGHRVHLVAGALPSRVAPSARLTFHQVTAPAYPLFEHAPYALAVASKLVDVARAERLDVIQAHYAVPHATSAYLARQILGAEAPRIVVALHGTDVTRVGADPSYRVVTCFAVSAADGITAPSSYLRDEARHRLGVPPACPIEVVPNFVDTERFSPASRRDRRRLHDLFPRGRGADGPVLFHVSNFRPVKRTADLIEVLARVRRHVPARLVAVGDGPDRAATQRLAAARGLSEEICFLGNRADFVDYLRHADAFLLPSEIESFGVAALEALSAAVPVFAYRVGGLPEVVADGTGRLVEPFDVDALADAVVEAVASPDVHEALVAGARAHVVARFRRAPAIERHEAYLRRIVAGGSELA